MWQCRVHICVQTQSHMMQRGWAVLPQTPQIDYVVDLELIFTNNMFRNLLLLPNSLQSPAFVYMVPWEVVTHRVRSWIVDCRTGETGSFRSKLKQQGFPDIWLSPVTVLSCVRWGQPVSSAENSGYRSGYRELPFPVFGVNFEPFRWFPVDTVLLLTLCPPATTKS